MITVVLVWRCQNQACLRSSTVMESCLAIDALCVASVSSFAIERRNSSTASARCWGAGGGGGGVGGAGTAAPPPPGPPPPPPPDRTPRPLQDLPKTSGVRPRSPSSATVRLAPAKTLCPDAEPSEMVNEIVHSNPGAANELPKRASVNLAVIGN